MPLLLMFAAALAVGVACGYLMGGRLQTLLGLRLAAPSLVFVAAALQLGAGKVPASVRPGLIVASYGVGGVWLACNARHRGPRLGVGMVLLAAGWLLNVVPILANGAMPVSRQALEATGAGTEFRPDQGHLWKHGDAGRGTAVPWLGDVIPLVAIRTVISVGDVLMLAGVAAATAGAMREEPSNGDDCSGHRVRAAAAPPFSPPPAPRS